MIAVRTHVKAIDMKIVESYIDHLKKVLDAGTDQELSTKLGIAKSTIASWRKRNSIPDVVLKGIRQSSGVDHIRFIYQFAVEKALKDRLWDVLLFQAAMRLAAEFVETEKINEWSVFIVTSKSMILRELLLQTTAPNDDLPFDDDCATHMLFNAHAAFSGRPEGYAEFLLSLKDRVTQDGWNL